MKEVPENSSQRKEIVDTLTVKWLINPGYSLKDGCWSWSSNTLASWFIEKDPDAGKDWRQKEKREAENVIFGYHHQLNGYESERTLRDSEGQGSLVMQSMGLKRVRHNLATEQQIEINFTKWTSGFKGFLNQNCAGTCAHTGTHIYTHIR